MRLILLLSSLFALSGCSPLEVAAAPRVPAKNLLVISLDTTRADHVGCYGYGRDTTPSVDQLAAGGVRFSSAWTPMPLTLPAHSALMTSRTPRGLSVTTNQTKLGDAALTLAERLKAEGFVTGGFVSAPVLHPECGLGQGFDVYEAPEKGTREAAEVHKSARDWLAKNKDERFFAFLHFYDAHAEYRPPTKFREPFGVTYPEGEALPPWDTMSFMRDPSQLTEELTDQAIRGYDAELASADARIGLLVKELDAVGLLDDTLIFVVADHGETFVELVEPYNYAFDHGEFLHPREIQVPFVVHAPSRLKLGQGVTLDSPVSLLDLMPTSLELLGLECAAPFEGRSLVGLMRGQDLPQIPIVSERQTFVTEEVRECTSGNEYAVLYGGWLLVESDGRGRELYDLHSDPEASTDLAGTNDYWSARLKAYLDVWLAGHPEGEEAVPQEISADRRKALDALGYATGG